jgi:Fe-S-cluster-containing hydrogenase component 2
MRRGCECEIHPPHTMASALALRLVALALVAVAGAGAGAGFTSTAAAIRGLLPPLDCRLQQPQEALAQGTWVKLICGASQEDAPLVRNLAAVYTLAGVSCIDVAADAAIVAAAQEGVAAGLSVAADCGASLARPWLMVSVNDDATDPHFRKASFDASKCPEDCPRPCERACPAAAITPQSNGVILPKCYGCGRCLDVCPLGLITAESYVRSSEEVLPLFQSVDAVEIHTRGDLGNFERTWQKLGGEASVSLRAVAVSFPDRGEDTAGLVSSLKSIMGDIVGLNIWQADGRPMSGDVGRGTALASVSMAKQLLGSFSFADSQNYLQLAGGTNDATAPKLLHLGLRGGDMVAGVAYGGYARKIVGTQLQGLDGAPIEQDSEALGSALQSATALVAPMKEWLPM